MVPIDRLRQLGAEVIHGSARLAGRRMVESRFTDHTPPVRLRAGRGVVRNPGTRPATPVIDGLTGTPYWTNRDAVRASSLPSFMIIIGGGAVGCEMA